MFNPCNERRMCCQKSVCGQRTIFTGNSGCCNNGVGTVVEESPIKFTAKDFPKLYPLFNCAVNEQCIGVSYKLGYVLCVRPEECCDVNYCILAEANIPGQKHCPYYVVISITYNCATKCAIVEKISEVDFMEIIADTLGWCPSICNRC